VIWCHCFFPTRGF